jgi:hypothetical protein
MLVGGAGLLAVVGGGWFVFLRDSTGGPEGAVKGYVSAVDSGNFEEAQSYVHEDSPSGGGLTNDLPEDADAVDISVSNVQTVDEEPGYNASQYESVQEFETVQATIEISGTILGQEIDESETTTGAVAKNADGEWKLWN